MPVDPHWTTLLFVHQTRRRPFLVQEYGELEGSTGYWAADEETGQEGFVQEFEDIFWVHDEAADPWVARLCKGGRRLTKKGFRKGIRKGKCGKGARFSFHL